MSGDIVVLIVMWSIIYRWAKKEQEKKTGKKFTVKDFIKGKWLD